MVEDEAKSGLPVAVSPEHTQPHLMSAAGGLDGKQRRQVRQVNAESVQFSFLVVVRALDWSPYLGSSSQVTHTERKVRNHQMVEVRHGRDSTSI